ncbi:hypothetical protein HanIR_Chr14g0689041 [Helianthus annuus]|nr:hypothetical protein HanIR_Chr14g0689041 [Helianthus annuus]
MSWFNLNYIFGESSDTNTSTFIPGRSVEGPAVPDSYDGRGNDNHAEEVMPGFRPHHNESLLPDLNEVIMPGDDHGYGCPDYEAGYGVSYGQEDYGNNFFVSGASDVQQDVGEPSYAQESLGDEQPPYPEVSYKTDQVRMIYILLKILL